MITRSVSKHHPSTEYVKKEKNMIKLPGRNTTNARNVRIRENPPMAEVRVMHGSDRV
jgi:hypothetical protein